MGVGFLYFTLGVWRENNLVSSWPETPGTILKKSITSSTGGLKSYFPYVEYEFKVARKQYQSNKVYKTFREVSTYEVAQSTLDMISEQSIMMRYNPQNPNDCFLLIVKFGKLQWFLMILGIAFFSIGLIGTVANLLIMFVK